VIYAIFRHFQVIARLKGGILRELITFAGMKSLSRFASYLFHPLLFPTYGTLLILTLNPNLFGPFDKAAQIKWIIVFALTFIFPVVWILMMKGLGMIDNFKLETSKERIVPYVATITFYLWTAWMYKANVHMKTATNPFIFYMMVGACISVSTAFFLNTWTLISLHTIGAGSLLGLLLILVKFSTFDLRWLFVGFILWAGIIGTARLILKAHTETQVALGYLIGFTGQFLAFNIISRFV
jgi:hypothetical protein